MKITNIYEYGYKNQVCSFDLIIEEYGISITGNRLIQEGEGSSFRLVFGDKSKSVYGFVSLRDINIESQIIKKLLAVMPDSWYPIYHHEETKGLLRDPINIEASNG